MKSSEKIAEFAGVKLPDRKASLRNLKISLGRLVAAQRLVEQSDPAVVTAWYETNGDAFEAAVKACIEQIEALQRGLDQMGSPS